MDIEQRVVLLKTIADTTRLRILGLLAERPRSGRELAGALSLSAPTISHHMARLVDVGIVTASPDGHRRVYALDAHLLDRVGAQTPPAPALADQEQTRHVRIFFDGPRLRTIPAKRKARVSVLLELLRRFEPERRYAEAEVNAILREAHEDVAFLRRELVDYRYLAREGGVYWVNPEVPVRDANEAQEVPAGEADWLREVVRGAVAR
ncbi:MAG: metalloregulator ArsR/SmtB family transcription factor [Propionibacteriaceae bacterium]|nr:metalloregulator ArsR/SmtB family transcription factor [Propionibacteriaceae bacterium]